MFNHSKKQYPDYLQWESRNKVNDKPIWYYYGVKYDESYSKYKLHISIHPDQFAEVYKSIHDLLHKAIVKGLIKHYKVYDVQLVQEHGDLDDAAAVREMHNPFVIYLKDSYDSDYLFQIAELCQKIENILNDVSPGIKRAPCDLPLPSPHIIFRQAFMDEDKKKKKYIYALDTSSLATQLIAEAKASEHYKTSCSMLDKLQTLTYIFLDDVEQLLKILNEYKNGLQEEQKRFNENGNGKAADILTLHIKKINKQISDIAEMSAISRNKECKDCQSKEENLQSGFQKMIDQTKGLFKSLEFSEGEKALLFSNKTEGMFAMMNILSSKSSSLQKKFQEANKQLDDLSDLHKTAMQGKKFEQNSRG